MDTLVATPAKTKKSSISLARSILKEQISGLTALSDMLGDNFNRALDLIAAASDQMVVTGIGKSGLIARKIAATLSSTGTPAIFIHPVEGVHGDLGAVNPESVLLALSKSGRTEELVKFATYFRRNGGRLIVVCEPGPSPLAELADVVLLIPGLPEAGPLGLAPTTSTLLMLALCDAVAMALLDTKGFGEEDFARTHPDGNLGRRILLRVSDLMHAGDKMPIVQDAAPFNELLLEMTTRHLGMACIVDATGGLSGVFTDGDLRRLFTRTEKPASLTAAEAWTQSRRDPEDPPVQCSTVTPTTLAVECLRLMRDSEITVLVVSESGTTPDGIIRLQDLVRAGLG